MTNEGEEFGTIGVYQKSGYQGESRCVPPRRTIRHAIPYRSCAAPLTLAWGYLYCQGCPV